jgi:hypothetical protein
MIKGCVITHFKDDDMIDLQVTALWGFDVNNKKNISKQPRIAQGSIY